MNRPRERSSKTNCSRWSLRSRLRLLLLKARQMMVMIWQTYSNLPTRKSLARIVNSENLIL